MEHERNNIESSRETIRPNPILHRSNTLDSSTSESSFAFQPPTRHIRHDNVENNNETRTTFEDLFSPHHWSRTPSPYTPSQNDASVSRADGIEINTAVQSFSVQSSLTDQGNNTFSDPEIRDIPIDINVATEIPVQSSNAQSPVDTPIVYEFNPEGDLVYMRSSDFPSSFRGGARYPAVAAYREMCTAELIRRYTRELERESKERASILSQPTIDNKDAGDVYKYKVGKRLAAIQFTTALLTIATFGIGKAMTPKHNKTEKEINLEFTASIIIVGSALASIYSAYLNYRRSYAYIGAPKLFDEVWKRKWWNKYWNSDISPIDPKYYNKFTLNTNTVIPTDDNIDKIMQKSGATEQYKNIDSVHMESNIIHQILLEKCASEQREKQEIRQEIGEMKQEIANLKQFITSNNIPINNNNNNRRRSYNRNISLRNGVGNSISVPCTPCSQPSSPTHSQ